jgi:hypothetical protein
MRCCRRRSWLALLAALWLALVAPMARPRGGMKCAAPRWLPPKTVTTRGDVRGHADRRLEDALNKGVPLHFLVEFELIRRAGTG